jgi:hypothetical protein
MHRSKRLPVPLKRPNPCRAGKTLWNRLPSLQPHAAGRLIRSPDQRNRFSHSRSSVSASISLARTGDGLFSQTALPIFTAMWNVPLFSSTAGSIKIRQFASHCLQHSLILWIALCTVEASDLSSVSIANSNFTAHSNSADGTGDASQLNQPKTRGCHRARASTARLGNLTLPSHSLATLCPAAFCKSCC